MGFSREHRPRRGEASPATKLCFLRLDLKLLVKVLFSKFCWAVALTPWTKSSQTLTALSLTPLHFPSSHFV